MMGQCHLVRNHDVKIFSLRWLIWTAMLLALPALQSASIPLAWSPSIDPGVVGYKIYWWPAAGGATNSVDVGNVTKTTITGLTEDTTYYFAATSYDTNGVESDFSNQIELTVYQTATLVLPQSQNGSNSVSGQFAINVSGFSNYLYEVQASTNLVNWVAVQTNSAPFAFVDTNAGQFKRRFYRVVNVTNPTGN
jgi:hypothetical protein